MDDPDREMFMGLLLLSLASSISRREELRTIYYEILNQHFSLLSILRHQDALDELKMLIAT